MRNCYHSIFSSVSGPIIIGRFNLHTLTAAQPAATAGLTLAPNPAHSSAALTLPAPPGRSPLPCSTP